MTNRLVIILSLLLSFSGVMASTNSNQEFNKGVSLFKTGSLDESLVLFKKLSKKEWGKNIGQKSLAASIEISFSKKDYKTSKVQINRFLTSFPDSPYKDRVLLLKAFCRIDEGDFYSAAEIFGLILKTTESKIQYVRAKNSMVKLIDAKVLTSNEMMLWVDKYQVDNEIMSNLMISIAEKSIEESYPKRAKYYANRIINEGLNCKVLIKRIEKVLEEANDIKDGKVTLLVMAPLTGSFADFGNAAIQGVLLAQSEADLNDKIEVKFLDTESNPVTAIDKAKITFSRDSIVGVVGPLLSNTATSVAVWLSEAYPSVPMITPTANTEGISALGKNIFQLNISPGILAGHIAEYGMKCLKIGEFGIMSPNTEYGRVSSSNFMHTVENAGRGIILNESYEEGSKDYQTQFNILREKGYTLKNKRNRIRLGSENINTVNGRSKGSFMADSVIFFDGFFLPASDPADVAMLASQYTYNKLDGILLGTSGWYGKETIKDGRNSVDNAFFATAFLSEDDRKEFKDFKKKFIRRWKSNPGDDKVSGLSYDASRILFAPLKKSKFGYSMINNIIEIDKLAGVYNDIIWDKETGQNINYHIIRVKQGRFVASDTCPTKEELHKINYRPAPPKKK